MDDSKSCKNCDNLTRKTIKLEIKIKELESKLSYYDNPNSPPSADSLRWKKQKKNRRSNHHSKPGQKDGHEGKTHNLKTNKNNPSQIRAMLKMWQWYHNANHTTSRTIADIPKPQPVTVTKHIIPSYMCKDCGGTTTVSCSFQRKEIWDLIFTELFYLYGLQESQYEILQR